MLRVASELISGCRDGQSGVQGFANAGSRAETLETADHQGTELRNPKHINMSGTSCLAF